jgi:pimeloyl-ACP methyl ester carboxylesterase
MAIVILVVVLAILALATQAGVLLVQRSFPAQGRMVEVAGGALHVVDIGPRDGAAPIVMLHGASSNLEVMRQPLGDRLARDHRVILIDRPGHGWNTRARFSDSTPEIQGRMIAEAFPRLASSARCSWCILGAGRWACGLRSIIRSACLVW